MNKLTLALYILIILVLVYEIVVTTDQSISPVDDLLPNVGASTLYSHAPPSSTTTVDVPRKSDVEGAVHANTSIHTNARVTNPYANVSYDAASFDIQEAQERAKRAYENDMAATTETTRGPASAPGGSNAAISNITGGVTVRPIVDNILRPPPPMIAPTPAGPSPIGPSERSDHRCGPSAGGAKCGPDRCCSIYGWCGSPGEPHCMPGINTPTYNGATTTLPPGVSNGGVIKCLTGEIYGIENGQKRLYPTLSIYEKHGSPPLTGTVDCAILNNVIPGTSYN